MSKMKTSLYLCLSHANEDKPMGARWKTFDLMVAPVRICWSKKKK